MADRNTHGLTCELYCRSLFKVDDYKKYRRLRDDVAYVEDFTLDLVDAPDEPFALRFLGDLKIEKPGIYTFFLTAQQGGAVTVNGRRLFEKDFTKKTEEVSAKMELRAGQWPLEVMFWKRGVSHRAALRWKVEWEGRDLSVRQYRNRPCSIARPILHRLHVWKSRAISKPK